MEYQQYLDERIHQLRIVCQSQWDYLKYADLDKWLNDNFPNDIEGRYYATKILLHTVYYTKKDLEILLNYGLNELIYGKIIKNELIAKNNIYIDNSEAKGEVFKLKQSTFFIPLLDSNKPSESGNLVIGDLVHKLEISDSQVGFHWNVNEEKLKNFKLLIFVDDCVGSGSQLRRFWNSKPIQKIKEICEKNSIKIYYLVQVGYHKNLKLLKQNNEIKGVEVVVCDLLTDQNRVFSDENIIWDKESNEREKVIEYFERIKKERGINFLGFKKLDFAVILHDRVPNWSLPIFWKKSSGWEILLQRKTSYK